MTTPPVPAPPGARPHRPNLLEQARRRPGVYAAGAGAALAGGLLLRKRLTGSSSTGSSSTSTGVDGSAASTLGLTSGATVGGSYDSTASDVYNSFEPLLEGINNSLNGLQSSLDNQTPPVSTADVSQGVLSALSPILQQIASPAPAAPTPAPAPAATATVPDLKSSSAYQNAVNYLSKALGHPVDQSYLSSIMKRPVDAAYIISVAPDQAHANQLAKGLGINQPAKKKKP